jgi:hypothetical protein
MSAVHTAVPAVPVQRVDEPTEQGAVVADAHGHVFVRLEHRWWQAGGATVDPVLWPDIHAVAVKSYGDPS